MFQPKKPNLCTAMLSSISLGPMLLKCFWRIRHGQRKMSKIQKRNYISRLGTIVLIFLDDLLKHKMFHRAKKIPVDSDMLKNKKKKKEADQETDDGNKSDAKQIAEKKKKR